MSSSSKLLLAGTAVLTVHRAFTPLRPFVPPKTPRPLHFHRLCSSVAAVEANNPEPSPPSSPSSPSSSSSALLHPWPEWVTFVDRLKFNGYLFGKDDEETGDVMIYKEMNLLKDPCLDFARDRYDLFQSLPSEDIRAIVEAGCPNILRKVVNSGKRLRAHLQIDEGDVCGSCDLRSSCDRAYVVPKDSEPSRTVDVVRLLMFYAVDPMVISGGEKPPSRELVELRARKVLARLVELSESNPKPPQRKQIAKAPPQEKKPVASYREDMPNDNKKQHGDWTCPKCNFMNFKKNRQCLKCRGDRPQMADGSMKEGDWICFKCNFMNFARNRRCRECSADGPEREGDNVEMKKGDWYCPKCNFMNFSSNKRCKSCREPCPPRELNPGEWECPSCNFLNFKRNEACRKCDSKRPRQGENEHEEWRRPY